MKVWEKWHYWVNYGSPVKLFYFGLLFTALTVGSNSYGDEVVPWIQNIFQNPYMGQQSNMQFLLTSFLEPFVAYILGIRTEGAYLALTLFGFVLGNVLVFKKLNQLGRTRFVVQVFLLYSLSGTLVLWFGKSDMWLFVFSTLLVLYRRHLLASFVLAFLMGMTHFEQSVVILGMLGLISLAEIGREKEVKGVVLSFLVALFGIVMAKASMSLFFWWNQFGGFESRLDYVLAHGYEVYVKPALANVVVFLFSLLGVFWLVFFQLSTALVAQYRLYKWVAWLAFLMAMGVSLFTFDTTRVFSIVFWPFIVYMLMEVPKEKLKEVLSEKLMPMLIAFSLLFPVIQLKMSGSLLFVGSLTYEHQQ